MAAGQYDFTIEQGATFVRPFVWKSSDGTPVNLTAYTARMQVRQSYSSGEILLNATTENGRLQVSGAEGKVTLSLTADVTAAITWRRGRYDLELVAPDGAVTRLLEGQITVSKEITRG